MIYNFSDSPITICRMSFGVLLIFLFRIDRCLTFVSMALKKTSYEFEATVFLTMILLANSMESKASSFGNSGFFNTTTEIIFLGVVFSNLFAYLYSIICIFLFAILYLFMVLNGSRGRNNYNGLSDRQVESIEKNIIPERELGDEEQKTCSICLSEFNKDEVALILPECEHLFHEECIKEWFKRNHFCPFCRNNVRRAIRRKKRAGRA